MAESWNLPDFDTSDNSWYYSIQFLGKQFLLCLDGNGTFHQFSFQISIDFSFQISIHQFSFIAFHSRVELS